MKAQLSRERLEALANLQSLECMALPASHAESAEMARMLLAGMDSVPVAWTDEQELRDLEKSGCAYLFSVNPITPNADPRRVIRLYAAPPATVAVPDELTREEYKRRFMEEDNFDDTYRGGWVACRAAMLKAGSVTAATVPDGLKRAVEFYKQVKRENPPVETGAWKDAVDWVLKEAMLAASPAAPEQEV